MFYGMLKPMLWCLEPEAAHALTLSLLKSGVVPGGSVRENPALRVRLWGLDFPNPVGLAAGFDKNAEVMGAMEKLGFGFTEVGSVTPLPQPGNPRPRLFRLPDNRAVINRMGFNNDGLEAVAERLKAHHGRIAVGVNLGKNRNSDDPTADYVAGVKVMGRLAGYLVVNVSSPNTPGLRALQSRAHLKGLLEAVMDARTQTGTQPPLLLKIAPDLTEEDKSDIAEIALETGIDGLIATNTTIKRSPELAGPHRDETGGLSGRPLLEPSTQVLADMYRLTGGKLPLIGAGGVDSAQAAYAKIRAGASLVQLYTALVFQGPGLVNEINRGLAEFLRIDGFSSVCEAVGADHR